MTDESSGTSYALGAVVRRTGLTEHVLRAWERRYHAITPHRTPGGSRRYTEAHIRRLILLRQAIEAGHTISEIARLPDAELQRLVAEVPQPESRPLEDILGALHHLDWREAERLLGMHFGALGPRTFALEVVAPLLCEIGERWEQGRFSIAAEHMASSITRSMLGVALRASAASASERPILFTTPEGERHEFGCLVAALVAVGVGGNPVYLGPDLPVSEVLDAAGLLSPTAVALGVVMADGAAVETYLRALRRDLPADVAVWVGGPHGGDLTLPARVEFLRDIRDLERQIRLTLARPA